MQAGLADEKGEQGKARQGKAGWLGLSRVTAPGVQLSDGVSGGY